MRNIYAEIEKEKKKLSEMCGKSNAELVESINKATQWNECLYECVELCARAGLLHAWENADSTTFRAVLIVAVLEIDAEGLFIGL